MVEKSASAEAYLIVVLEVESMSGTYTYTHTGMHNEYESLPVRNWNRGLITRTKGGLIG